MKLGPESAGPGPRTGRTSLSAENRDHDLRLWSGSAEGAGFAEQGQSQARAPVNLKRLVVRKEYSNLTRRPSCPSPRDGTGLPMVGTKY